MSEEDILDTTYDAACSIYRMGASTKDPDTKLTKQQKLLISENVPCAISSQIGGKLNLTDGYGHLNSDYVLFCRPKVDVKEGDQITILTKAGQTFKLWAGRPFIYVDSHAEVPLTEEKRT